MLKNVSYKRLYIIWAVMYVLTVVLGFLFPQAEESALTALRLTSIAFFLPPALILMKARADGSGNRKIVGNLSAASLAATTVLLVLNIMSVSWSEALGNALFAALTVVSAPMVCSNLYALPLFLWAVLLVVSMKKK